MRDPRRINEVLGALERLWRANPDYRLGQLLFVASAGDSPIHAVEDDQMLRHIESMHLYTTSKNVQAMLSYLIKPVQNAVIEALDNLKGNPPAAGLSDGHSIVRDYLKHNEHRLAFEHLTYMLGELELRLNPRDEQIRLRVATQLGLTA